MRGGTRRSRSYQTSIGAGLLSLLVLATLAACSGIRTAEPQKKGAPDPGFRVVRLYFLSNEQETQPAVAKAPPVRWIRLGKQFHTRVMRALLAGPIPAEGEVGYYSDFRRPTGGRPPWPATSVPKKSLKAYLNHVQVIDGVATVDFDAPALAYLDAPAGIRSSVLEPIRQTLMSLAEIDTVRIVISGSVFTEWRA